MTYDLKRLPSGAHVDLVTVTCIVPHEASETLPPRVMVWRGDHATLVPFVSHQEAQTFADDLARLANEARRVAAADE